MDCHAFAFRQLGNSAHQELDLVSSLDRAGGIRIGPDLERIVGDEPMPVTAQGTPVLASHGSGDADHPGPEPVRLSQSSEVSEGPQETLLRQVVDDRGIIPSPMYHAPDKARVTVVEAAERVAVSSQNTRHKIRIGQFTIRQHQETSGRRRRIVQELRRLVVEAGFGGRLTLRVLWGRFLIGFGGQACSNVCQDLPH